MQFSKIYSSQLWHSWHLIDSNKSLLNKAQISQSKCRLHNITAMFYKRSNVALTVIEHSNVT